MSDQSGPAFPTRRERDGLFLVWTQDGMSLRDYFAAQALIAITASDHVDGQGDPERHAALAYKYADAMLEERSKP